MRITMRGPRFLGKAGKASVRVEGQTDQHQIAAFYCWARVGSDTPLSPPLPNQRASPGETEKTDLPGPGTAFGQRDIR